MREKERNGRRIDRKRGQKCDKQRKKNVRISERKKREENTKKKHWAIHVRTAPRKPTNHDIPQRRLALLARTVVPC